MAAGNGMGNLISIVNQLQDVCRQMGTTVAFDLPQIAVIGAQSAGKSSVLENIVGSDFLPRGSGIVTRRPLILQLHNREEEYGKFGHCEKKFIDFNDIRAEIEAETDRLTGTNKGISSKPIGLSIYSPNVLDLTLIDLPGITKVPVGDQPEDIEQQIRDMIHEFIHKENCLILAVSPANADLANSDALKLAKEVDEKGLRTIGVITKLDLMDEGTDAREIFLGKLLPLRRGYIGVVNRSQKDIENKKDIAATLQAERDFFQNHNAYKDIAHRLGTGYLQKVLHEQLTQHIAKTLTSLKEETRGRMNAIKKEMEAYESLHPEDSFSMKGAIIKAIQGLQADFSMEMGMLGSIDVHVDQLCCGARIRRIFDECLPDLISKIPHEGDALCEEIANAIDNSYGYRGIVNTPSLTLEAHLRKQIKRLTPEIENSIGLVVDELKNAVRNSTKRIKSYPKFRSYIENDIISHVNNNLPSYKKNVLLLVKMQQAYINSSHFVINRGDEVIREGLLNLELKINNIWSSTKYSFILKSNVLICVEDGSMQFKLELNEVKFRLMKGEDEDDKASTIQKIVLFKPTQNPSNPSGDKVLNPIYNHHTELILSSEKLIDIRLWKKSFSKVIELEGVNRINSLQDEVDDAYEKISAYMGVVKTTLYDMVPKAITLFIIRDLEKFIGTDLLIKMAGTLDDEKLNLFGADKEEARKHEENKKLFETCAKALKVMEESNAQV